MKKYNHHFIYEVSFQQNSPFFPKHVYVKSKKKYPSENMKNYRKKNTHMKLEQKIKTIKK